MACGEVAWSRPQPHLLLCVLGQVPFYVLVTLSLGGHDRTYLSGARTRVKRDGAGQAPATLCQACRQEVLSKLCVCVFLNPAGKSHVSPNCRHTCTHVRTQFFPFFWPKSMNMSFIRCVVILWRSVCFSCTPGRTISSGNGPGRGFRPFFCGAGTDQASHTRTCTCCPERRAWPAGLLSTFPRELPHR